jgi:5-methylcytosine-specific restriction endonuclease McrA
MASNNADSAVDDFIQRNGLRLSKVKREILLELWPKSGKFPGTWVSTEHLLDSTKQKYFDRRCRELRDERGLDIEVKPEGRSYYWRLRSSTLQPAKPRVYLPTKKKQELFEQHQYRCNVCGYQGSPGDARLQADHRIPALRGNVSKELGFWQPLCTDCNVTKRRACQDCILDCSECSWAFPEEHPTVVIPLSPDKYATLKSRAKRNGVSESAKAKRLLEEDLGPE